MYMLYPPSLFLIDLYVGTGNKTQATHIGPSPYSIKNLDGFGKEKL